MAGSSSRDLVALHEVVTLLAPTLGQERSYELVTQTARQKGFREDGLVRSDALTILEILSKQPGITGVAARHARDRFASGTAWRSEEPASASRPIPGETEADPISRVPASSTRVSPSKPPGPPQVTREEIAELLSRTLGLEKSQELVAEVAKSLGIPSGPFLTKDQALGIMERLATYPGIVGVTARFAKARLILKLAA